MHSKPVYIFLFFIAFGICGWLGTLSFLHHGSAWLGMKNTNIVYLMTHEHTIRAALISSIWGGVCSIPFYKMHAQKHQWILPCAFFPISIVALPSLYMYLWPSSYQAPWFEKVKIIVAQEWLYFSYCYILCILLPFSLWSYLVRNRTFVEESK